ncbi:MAG TPA: T9SS type A sorting domain-containing protein [Chryseosolibacter sp.]|nr:T9SS type A sorting domain-containing protein [Chryseosolibacter sp.]
MRSFSIGCAISFAGLLLFRCTAQPEEVRPGDNILSVFPNPCYDGASVSITNTSANSYFVRVYDPEGKEILNKPVNASTNFSVPVEAKLVGTYHVLVKVGGETLETSFVKIEK